MHVIDEDLRIGRGPIGALDHFLALGCAMCRIDLIELDAFFRQQTEGCRALTAEITRIDSD